MSPELTKEPRTLQKEHQRLRKIIAEERIDLEILKQAMAVAEKNV